MPNIVPLSGGFSAELREASELTERQRRPVTRAMALVSPSGQTALDASNKLREDEAVPADKKMSEEKRAELKALVQFTAADIDILNEANDAAAVAFIKHWTRPEDINLESILGLPGADYDAIREAVAPLTNALFVSFAPDKAPDSPTAPSSDSATRSEGELSTVHQTSGAPTGSSR